MTGKKCEGREKCLEIEPAAGVFDALVVPARENCDAGARRGGKLGKLGGGAEGWVYMLRGTTISPATNCRLKRGISVN